MPKRKITFKTFWQVTTSIAVSPKRLGAWLIALCACAPLFAHADTAPSLTDILRNHTRAMQALQLRDPRSHEIVGTIAAPGASGDFHEWQDGSKQRRDENLGIRSDKILRVGDQLWMQNASGEVRQLSGILADRQITQDFIDTEAFVDHPEALHYIGPRTLPDGRMVYEVRVAPKGGETYVVGIDAKSWYIDEESYDEHDATQTSIFSDFRVVSHMLVPYTEVDSNGDRAFDVTTHVSSVTVDGAIDPAVFAPFTRFTVYTAAPVTVPYELVNGHPLIEVTIAGARYRFLVDSGSQSDVYSKELAVVLGLHPTGVVEVSGAVRIAADGLVETPDMYVGAARFGQHVASVVDLSSIPGNVDGILGYSFFAAAEIRFNPDAHTLTVGAPGSLAVVGQEVPLDTDRELPEMQGEIEGAPTRLLVDTGDDQELLVFSSFLESHQGLISYAGSVHENSHGVGGSNQAIGTIVDELDIGPYRMYQRHAAIILASRGAFADRNDGGNVGFATLSNFISTFDLAGKALYLSPARGFDNGRFRARFEQSNTPITSPSCSVQCNNASSLHAQRGRI